MNYIQQAFKGKSEWHFWLITILVVFIGWQVLGAIPLSVVAYAYAGGLNEFIAAGADNFMSLGINKNLFLFLMLFMFALGLVFLVVSIKYIHKRTMTSLIRAEIKLIGNDFGLGFLVGEF